jgi:DNA primase
MGNPGKKINFVDRNQKAAITRLIDPFKLCDELGIEIFRVRGNQIRACCPIHKGMNQTAFSIDWDPSGRDAPVWMCRTECGDRGDIFTLIMKLFGCSFIDSVNWLAKHVGMEVGQLPERCSPISTIHEDDVRSFLAMSGHRRTYNSNSGYTCKDINPQFVKRCSERRSGYFEERGYPKEILDYFKVGFCPAYESEWKEDREIVPFWNKDGDVIGISGRIIKEGSSAEKYKILSGSNKKETLYGLNLALPYIMKSRSVMLVEGFTDVWTSWMYGKQNVVAVMGKAITKEQLEILLSLVETVAIAFDGDAEGRMGANTAIDMIGNFFTVYDVVPPVDKDIGDLDKQEFFKALKSAEKKLPKSLEK